MPSSFTMRATSGSCSVGPIGPQMPTGIIGRGLLPGVRCIRAPRPVKFLERVVDHDSESRPRKFQHRFGREARRGGDDLVVERRVIPPIGGDGTEFAWHRFKSFQNRQLGILRTIVVAQDCQPRSGSHRSRAEAQCKCRRQPSACSNWPRHSANRQRHFVHRQEVGVHALARVEPAFWLSWAASASRFAAWTEVVFDEEIRRHPPAQRIAQAVRHRVINRDVARTGRARGSGVEIRHAARERRGHGQPASVGVIFHVILRRMSEDNARLHFANDRGESAQRSKVVKDFEVVAQLGW